MIFAEKCKVSRTGTTSFGWHFGRGYVIDKITVKSEVWCIIDGSKVIAECRGKVQAERIAAALNLERSNIPVNHPAD